jgi:thioesterase domain-containing protein/acyl carrier protein
VPAQDDGRRTKDDEPRDPSFVVGPSSFASALRAFLTARLPGYMLPSAFVVLDGLPRTPNGKLDRRALPAPEQAGSMRESTYVAPRDLTELRLVRVWEDLLGVQPIGVHDNFFDLGGHSLLVVRLIARIQQQFGQSIPLAALFQDATIEYMATLLHQRPSDEQRSPLVALQAVGANPPFFCVHPGAGNVLCYVELAHSLGHTQPFYGLQAAGLEDAQAPRGSVEAMATAYLTALRVVQPHGPYRLGGWSFGGLVAFEMAQQLHAQGQTVALLALIDSTPPTDAAPIDEVALLAWFAHDLGRMAGNPVPLTLDELRLIAPEQRLRYLLDQARVANVLPPDIDEQQIRRGLAVFAANIQAMQRYQPQPYAGRVTLFRASVQMPEDAADPTLGWGALATDGVALYTIPGDHYSIVRPPQVRLLAEQLHACLEAVPADAPDAPDAQIDRALECALCVEL